MVVIMVPLPSKIRGGEMEALTKFSVTHTHSDNLRKSQQNSAKKVTTELQ